ncbi:PepSY-associated TM helix domain-containing protein [Flammeovirgaceae bacterium SG7u.111]|nr:PepSY-associated TM helix domain-containing protein [Flammeovirgaceae bacterium SG7u.132]WPO38534.1 PepSY-associated TM helix domain-containing protein [Flammeovirgaceae bacterium SG7u.111]
MSKKFKTFCRNYHRDIAYVFVGLILAFSISGIALNHRRSFNSRQFTMTSESLTLKLPQGVEEYDDEVAKSLIPQIGIGNEYRRVRVQEGRLKIYFEDAMADVSLETGEGQLDFFGRRYGLAEMADLHQTTNPAWIWYSDIFGVAMIFIAISGMFISSGKFSFKKRGWWMALAGAVFPLIFLFFLA